MRFDRSSGGLRAAVGLTLVRIGSIFFVTFLFFAVVGIVVLLVLIFVVLTLVLVLVLTLLLVLLILLLVLLVLLIVVVALVAVVVFALVVVAVHDPFARLRLGIKPGQEICKSRTHQCASL